MLAPIAFFQMILWVYCFVEVIGSYLYSAMGWEQELPDNWLILHIAFFIWTNQLLKIFKKQQ